MKRKPLSTMTDEELRHELDSYDCLSPYHRSLCRKSITLLKTELDRRTMKETNR